MFYEYLVIRNVIITLHKDEKSPDISYDMDCMSPNYYALYFEQFMLLPSILHNILTYEFVSFSSEKNNFKKVFLKMGIFLLSKNIDIS